MQTRYDRDEHDDDAPVGRVRLALGQPGLLEAVGDAGHARVVAVQGLREVGELHRLIRLQSLQRERLLRSEPELLRDGEQLPAVGEEQVQHEPPGLLLPRGGAYDLCHRPNIAGPDI